MSLVVILFGNLLGKHNMVGAALSVFILVSLATLVISFLFLAFMHSFLLNVEVSGAHKVFSIMLI